jgi:hypothetical protein
MMEALSRTKTIFLSSGSFASLIFFQIWVTADHTPESLLIAALLLLAYSALIIVLSYRWDKPGYFDWAIAAYFTVVSSAYLFGSEDMGEYLRRYAATGVYVSLFIAAFLPPVLGMDPFTFRYAKRSAPPETWDTPIFIKINRMMTFVWSGIFAIGIVLSLFPSIIMRTIIPNGLILGFGLRGL